MTATDLQATFVRRIDDHRGILFKVASGYCRQASDREDLIAETIAQLWRSYPRFDDRFSFATWMYRIAVNVAISYRRAETRRRRTVDQPLVEDLPAPQAEEADENLARLREFIDGLAPLDRALMLLYLDDLPYAEIAAILGISETNVGTKISRIKTRLKRNVIGESH